MRFRNHRYVAASKYSSLTDSHCAGIPAVCADAGRGSAPPPGQVRRGEVPDLLGRTGVQVRMGMSSLN